ncbi:MAG: cystathionine gamma-synthase [Gammaproteobacteria bacterium SG8_30]|nr:MAG: cystathionine gamma-synthase [Gammaproteobacteria bacterium SG8_30]
MTDHPDPRTVAVRAGLDSDAEHGAVVPPIYLSSTYTFEGLNRRRRYDYSRSGNPTRDALGEALAALEHGAGAVVTATGMAAVNLGVVLARPGERIVAPYDCYGGTYRLLAALDRTGRVHVDFIDLTDPAALAGALDHKPRIVWIETPSNPLLRITDIDTVARAAHEVAALVVVDNTFLSPGWQNPIDLGADLVVHSTTKYINGHSDVVGGAVVSRDEGLYEELAWWANCLGITGGAFDAFLTLRGLRTLHARLRLHEENAAAVARLVSTHPAVSRSYYPGLPGHPGHALAARQQSGFGAMVSFELAGGVRAVARFLDGLQHFSLAESLGGVESLIAHPDTMTHAAMDPAARAEAGITPGLLRLSVGIEATEDLLRDLQAALDRAVAG